MVPKPETPNIVYVLVVVGVTSLFFLLDLVGFFKPLHNYVDFIYDPVLYWQQKIVRNINQTTDSIMDAFELKQENTDLRKEVIALEEYVVEYNELQTENEALREQLDVTSGQDLKLIESRALMYDLIDQVGTIKVNKGSRNGVDEGALVIAGDYLVGIVGKVSPYSCIINTLYSGELQLPATIIKRDTRGIVEGNVNGIEMNTILQVDDAKKGDTVALWDERYPLNILIGKIEEISNDPTSPYKTATVEPLLDYTEIPYLFIIDND